MLDPANALLPPPCSPTNSSSSSSSDLDTESTGSFFHDRSTTLGTLMGVNFPAIAFRVPSHRGDSPAAAASANGGGCSGGVRRRGGERLVSVAERRRRRWWSLCRDDEDDSRLPSSLGEFLEAERRFGDVALFGAEVEGGGGRAREGGTLFADGRVLPPRQAAEEEEEAAAGSSGGVLCRFPVSLTGICSGGTG